LLIQLSRQVEITDSRQRGFPRQKMLLRGPVAAATCSGHIQRSDVVFIDVRSASAASGLALTWLTMVDKTRALNDRR
jgi:hypothetical protein